MTVLIIGTFNVPRVNCVNPRDMCNCKDIMRVLCSQSNIIIEDIVMDAYTDIIRMLHIMITL